RMLQRQAAGHFMERRYIAIVEGRMTEERGTWRTWFGEKDDLTQSIAWDEDSAPEDAKEAITHFRTLENLGPISVLELRLETGRTHQIRIHCAEAGHPVVGDRVYHRLAKLRHPQRRFGGLKHAPPRMMLHAA